MRTLLLGFCLLAALPASAQATFGIKAGVNAATISGDTDELLDLPDEEVDGFDISKQSRLGFVVGVTADVPLSPTFSFRPEILYTQKGYAIETNIDGSVFEGDVFDNFNGTITGKIDYLEVPLLFAYTFPTSSTLDIAIEAGPTLAYKLSTGVGCSGDYEDLGEDGCDDDGDDDSDDGVEDFDLGGAVGVTVGSGPFGVGIRYTNGFLSIATDEESDTGNDLSIRNQVFTATLHYRFGGN